MGNIDDNIDKPSSGFNRTPFPFPEQIREEALQKAQSIKPPDLDSMNHEEILHMVYEMQVKQIEADLQVKQLSSQHKKRDDQSELFRIINDNMLDMVALTDMEGNFNFAGKAHEILGYGPGFLIGKNVMDFVHPEDLPCILEEFAEFVATGHPRRVEYRYRCGDGTYLWLKTIGSVLGDESDSPWKIVFSSRNITERKQVEMVLRESEELYCESEKRVREKLNAILLPEGDIGLLDLADILDTEAIQVLMNEFYRLTSISGSIIDLYGNLLVSTGWQDICTMFHRRHPEAYKNCIESDVILSAGTAPGQFKAYRCKNNMLDIATPILIGDKHFGNIILGQFFYEDEEIDYGKFRAQARKYGFDEQMYMNALERVPRFSRKEIEMAANFYSRLAEMISTLSYSNLKLARTIEKHKRNEKEREKLQAQLAQGSNQFTCPAIQPM